MPITGLTRTIALLLLMISMVTDHMLREQFLAQMRQAITRSGLLPGRSGLQHGAWTMTGGVLTPACLLPDSTCWRLHLIQMAVENQTLLWPLI